MNLSLVGGDGKINSLTADHYEKMCKLIVGCKREKRVKGFKVQNVNDRETTASLNAIHKFFNSVRDSFFHLQFPRHGTKIKNMEATVPQSIIDSCSANHTDIIVRLLSESLHRLIFDDRNTIMGRQLLTCERK